MQPSALHLFLPLIRAWFRERFDTPINVQEGSWWPAMTHAFKEIIADSRSTLFFTNSRRHAEKITRLINEDQILELAYPHHGSLAKELRLAGTNCAIGNGGASIKPCGAWSCPARSLPAIFSKGWKGSSFSALRPSDNCRRGLITTLSSGSMPATQPHSAASARIDCGEICRKDLPHLSRLSWGKK